MAMSSWQDALRNTLTEPLTKALSAGRTGDELFFVAAVVGAPGLWMEARESIRERNIVDAVEKSCRRFSSDVRHDNSVFHFIWNRW